MLKRQLAFLGASATLAFSLFTVASVAAPQVVGACNWYTEHYTVSSAQVNPPGIPEYIELVTLNDGCGDKYYQSFAWNNYNYGFEIETAAVRVWVCGNFQGIWVASYNFDVGWGSRTLSFHYGGCVRQADTWGTHLSPPTTNLYVNQG